MNDALIKKFYELHPEKKEKPKVIKAENATIDIKPGTYEQKDPRKLAKCYDPDSLKASFQQVAEQLQTGKAKVVSMNMDLGDFSGLSTTKRITFDVLVYE